jgi:hypothetical protein
MTRYSLCGLSGRFKFMIGEKGAANHEEEGKQPEERSGFDSLIWIKGNPPF